MILHHHNMEFLIGIFYYLEFLVGSVEMELVSFQLTIFSMVTMQNFEVETVDTLKGTTLE